MITKPQAEFPYINKAKEIFDVKETVCFAYKDTCYTNYKLSKDLVVHESVHFKQQSAMGADTWWDKFFTDNQFRLSQELEAYRAQLASIKDRNARHRVRLQVIDDLSGGIYGNCIGKEQLQTML